MLDELLDDFDPKRRRLSEQPVITRYRQPNANLRTQLERIIRAAGLEPWPALFNSLRSTRETELVNEGFAEHVVCKWLGNSPSTARRALPAVHLGGLRTGHRSTVAPKSAPIAVHYPVSEGDEVGMAFRGIDKNPEKSATARKRRRSKAPPVGLEPTTQRLTAACSTN